MFAKVFASLWKGSLRGDPYGQLIMIYACANCNADGVLDEHPRSIAEATGIPIDVVWDVCRRFMDPDPDSRSHEEDGRRFIALDNDRSWGWRIVNYEKYRQLRGADDRRDYHRNYYRENRSPRSTLSTRSQHSQQASTQSQVTQPIAEAEAEADKDISPDPVAFRFPVVGIEGELDYPVLESQVVRWAELYPAVDIRAELRKALGWAEANPRRRKTRAGLFRHLNAWIAKVQDQTGRVQDLAPPVTMIRPTREAVAMAEQARREAFEAYQRTGIRPADPEKLEAFERALELHRTGGGAS